MASPRVRQILLEVLTDPPGRTSTAEQVLRRLCTALIAALPVDGAGVALMTPAGHAGLVVASDAPAAAMEDLQQTLGEGPCLDASRDGRPVLLPDLVESSANRWPAFTMSAADAGIAAVFAFPLQVGAIRLGVLDLYRRTTGSLDRLELAEALDFASAATTILLELQHGAPIGQLHPLSGRRRRWAPGGPSGHRDGLGPGCHRADRGPAPAASECLFDRAAAARYRERCCAPAADFPTRQRR